MRTHLNTLYVTRDHVRLRKDGAAVAVRLEGETVLRVPLHNLEGIVCFGWTTQVTPALMAAAVEAGLTISFLSPGGHLRASIVGYRSGNVLLRREQYRRADDEEASLAVAAEIVAAKIANCRIVLLRAARESDGAASAVLREAARGLVACYSAARRAKTLASLRGTEGLAAAGYFAAFPVMLTGSITEFTGRRKHPATDPVNCLLSFCYGLVRHDLVAACETVGLDPAVGFLHRDRPGRPGLALDLMEELRPVLGDRLVLTLLNRRQLAKRDFETAETGVTTLSDVGRRAVIAAYQERKLEPITHPFLGEKVTWGLVPHLQARLLGRHLRGDLEAYPPFYWR